MSTFLECPNCNAIWGSEEIDFQECDCCGWPDDDCCDCDDQVFLDDLEEEQEAWEREVYGFEDY